MVNGLGLFCFKEINCDICAHYIFLCSGIMKPSTLGKAKATQIKRASQRLPSQTPKNIHWIDLP